MGQMAMAKRGGDLRTASVFVALALLWAILIFFRDAWTPDEPRELALSASQVGEFTLLPSLGGNPFTEKPPLAYWIAGLSMRAFGPSAAAARLPDFFYALIATACVYLLGRRMGTRSTGVLAALIFATATQVLAVQVWLATDALLLAGVSAALLGVHRAFAPGATARDRWIGCAWMHAGLLVAVFTKNFPGWLVPIGTLIVYLFSEKRWRELAHPAFWLPLCATLGLVGWWARDVGLSPGGSAHLHALFWDNLAGRLASYTSPSESIGELGHRNRPGKYLFELPVYLLPWTAVAVAALARWWRDRAARAMTAASVRFALSAFIPGFLVLSAAATGRGVYVAPVIIGLALFTAVMLTRESAGKPADLQIERTGLNAAVWTVMILDGVLLASAGFVQLKRADGSAISEAAALLGITGVLMAGIASLKASKQPSCPESLAPSLTTRLAAIHISALIALSLTTLPLLDRSQDLGRLAALIEKSSQGRPIILWRPDETTLAMSDLYLRKPRCVIPLYGGTAQQRATQLSQCLRDFPRAALIALAHCSARECGAVRVLLTHANLLEQRDVSSPDPALTVAGLQPVASYVRPGGRAYVIEVKSASLRAAAR